MRVLLRFSAAMFTLVGFFSGTVAIADITACTNLSSDVERLACYDSSVGYNRPNRDGTVLAISNWIFTESRDSFTGKNKSSITLKSEANGEIGSHKPQALVLRCDGEGSYQTYMSVDGYIGRDSIRVRYKFGADTPVSEYWLGSAQGTAIFLPDRYSDFRKRLATGDDFVFEVTDFRDVASNAKFDNSITDRLTFIMSGCQD